MADASAPEYRVFGGVLRSALEFPELPPAEGNEPTWDLTICRTTPSEVTGELLGTTNIDDRVRVDLLRHADGWRVTYSDTGTFDIDAEGHSIRWRPGDEHDPSAARVDVLGRVLAVALHAAGVLCLHGSAVAFPGGTIAFLAPKYHGKSTTALALARSGGKLVTDDCLPVIPGDPPKALPGVHAVRLWRDSANQMEHHGNVDVGPGGKLLLTDLPPERLMHDESRLAAIHLLTPVLHDERDSVPAVERIPVGGLDAAVHLLGQTKIGALLGGAEAGALLRLATEVAATVPVYRLRVVRDFDRLDEVVEGIRGLHPELLSERPEAVEAAAEDGAHG